MIGQQNWGVGTHTTSGDRVQRGGHTQLREKISGVGKHRASGDRFQGSSVADPDPDPMDPHHFAGSGSGSIIFSMDPDPDPDLNQANHDSPPPSHLIFHT